MLVAIASLAEAVILLLVGVLVFQLRLPTDVFGWFTLTWVFILGIVSCSLLGIFVSNFASNAVSAAVITNGPAVGLQFLSGTYVPLMVLPTWMLIVGSIFPVKWMAQGFRSVLLPAQMVVFEPAGSWEHWRTSSCPGGVVRGRCGGVSLRIPMVGSGLTQEPRCPHCSRSPTTSFFRSPSYSAPTPALAAVPSPRSSAGGGDDGGRILARPFGIGMDMACCAAVAVPHQADDRCRDDHASEPGGHLRDRPTRTRALHVSGGSLLQARHPQRAFTAGWCDLRGWHRRPTDPRRPRRMVDGRARRIFHGQGRALARCAVHRSCRRHYGVSHVGVDRLRLRVAQYPAGTMALSCAAVDDACSWVLLATVVATAKGSLFGAVLAIGGGLAYLLFMVYVGRPLLGRLETWTPPRVDVERTGGLPIAHTSVVLLVVLAADCFTDAVGIYSVFGAFVAGAVMPRGALLESIRERFEPLMAYLLLPAFFIYSGLEPQLSLVSARVHSAHGRPSCSSYPSPPSSGPSDWQRVGRA